ncbi:MAG: hypothetical protein ACPLZG_11455 [Thermoproteota archaeon]
MLALKRIDPVFSPKKLSPDDAVQIAYPVDFVVFNGMNIEKMRYYFSRWTFKT